MNKRKVLDAARKHAQKGAKEKALKEYARLLKEDSRDAKLLLEMGDAHRRWGQNEEAISHYLRVADQYMSGGFDARAVAVFKQILNLDEKRYPAYVSLAELYQRMGLDAEAVNALQTAADGYHREGQKPEALELLRKMATLDPSNTTSRMKVAELLRQEELIDESVSEYEAVVEELARQGAHDELVPVYERILEMRPERSDIEFSLARHLVQQSKPERAEPFARRAFDNQRDGDGHFDLLCGIYSELDKTEELSEVTKAMAQVYRARGDEALARELMQRLPQDNSFEVPAGAADAAPGTSDDDLLGDDDFLDDDFLSQSGVSSNDDDDSFIEISDDDDLEIDLSDEVDDGDDDSDDMSRGGDDSSSHVGLPEGDPDQLFAEASVYLRYGKRDQAIASLEAILTQEPRHRDALEKTGECYADAGDPEKAVGFWLEAAGIAASAGDDMVVDTLCERIAILDPSAAEGFARTMRSTSPAQADAPIAEGVNPDRDDFDGEPEIDLEDFTQDEIEVDAADGEKGEAVDIDDDEFEIDVDVDIEIDMDDEDDVEMDLEEDADIEVEIEIDDDTNDPLTLDPQAESQSARTASASRSVSAAGNATHSDLISEELEEAQFYMEQELFDEAEAIYQRVLKVEPKHPSAMLRMGELRAARGEDPNAAELVQSSADDVTLGPADLPFEDSGSAEGIDLSEHDDAEDSGSDLGDESEVDIAVEHDVDLSTGDEVDSNEIEVEVEDADGVTLSGLEDDEQGSDSDEPLLAATDQDDSGNASSGSAAYEVEIDFSDDDSLEFASDDEAGETGLQHDGTMPLYEDDDDVDVDDSSVSEASSSEIEIDLSASNGNETDVEEDVEEEVQEDVEEDVEEEVQEDIEEEIEVLVEDEDEDDSFDLAAELREIIEEEDEQCEGAELTSEQDGMASIFKEFKSGVAKTLAADDFETRFDLGIAYRGMELYDDALGEFRICLGSDGHKLESLHMMGLCAIDLGRYRDAANHLEQALAYENTPGQKEAGLRFDLGRSFELLGDFARAKEAFEAAMAADETIPGIDDCVMRVAVQMNDEEVEVADEPTASEEEGFENFDDLVAEVEAADVVREPEARAAAESEEAPAAKKGSKKGKNKRISFV